MLHVPQFRHYTAPPTLHLESDSPTRSNDGKQCGPQSTARAKQRGPTTSTDQFQAKPGSSLYREEGEAGVSVDDLVYENGLGWGGTRGAVCNPPMYIHRMNL